MDLVIALYKENIEWIASVSHIFKNIYVYNKSESSVIDQTHIPLPNIGRESQTYIHHIVKYYHTGKGSVVFCQGNPHDHTSIYQWQYLLREDDNLDYRHLSQREHIYDAFSVNNLLRKKYANKKMTFISIFNKKYFCGKDDGIYWMPQGAIFLVSWNVIRKRRIEFWKTLLNDHEKHDCQWWYPYVLECFWPKLFDKKHWAWDKITLSCPPSIIPQSEDGENPNKKNNEEVNKSVNRS